MAEAKLPMNKETGLVPCTIKISEAGLGLRAGEVRGLELGIAKAMIAKGHAEPYEAADEAEKKAK